MRHLEILNGIRDADFHEGGFRCLQLLAVDVPFFERLREDILRLCHVNQPSEVSQKDHITSWTQPYGETLQFSLLNSSGDYADTSTDHNQSCLGKQFHERDAYPTLSHFIDLFPHCINFRLNSMGLNSGLSPHEEHVTLRLKSGEVGVKARFHLPIVTNSRAEVMLDGYIYSFKEGIVYFFNNGCVHSASNGGTSARLHLVWDMLITEEAYERMFGEQDIQDLPIRRILGAERMMNPLRRVQVKRYERIPGFVSRSEARSISFCKVQ